jgi:hypothetical protein
VLAAARVLGYLLALAAGVAAGLTGSFKFGYTYGWLPVGLLVRLGLCLAVFMAAGLLLGSRSAAAVAAFGWLGAVVVMLPQRPEGDLIVPATALGYSWLLFGTLVACLSLGVPYAAISATGHAPGAPADLPVEESSGTAPTGR